MVSHPLRQRSEYVLTVVGANVAHAVVAPAGFTSRAPEPADRMTLAELMLAAYRGTIDDEGETLADAIAEVDRFLSVASNDPPLLEHSVLLSIGPTVACACLVGRWHRRRCPLVAYVMCHPDWRRRGLAAAALAATVRRLSDARFGEVRAVITNGNVASERLFGRAGFSRVVAPSCGFQ